MSAGKWKLCNFFRFISVKNCSQHRVEFSGKQKILPEFVDGDHNAGVLFSNNYSVQARFILQVYHRLAGHFLRNLSRPVSEGSRQRTIRRRKRGYGIQIGVILAVYGYDQLQDKD